MSLYDVVDAPLKYFSKCVSLLQFASECMEFSRRLRSANELLSDDDTIKDIIEKFVIHTRQKFVENLIQEIENVMKEKIEVLNYFYAFNTQSKADCAKNISELAKYYGQPKQYIFEGNPNEVFPIVDEQQCVSKIDSFVKEFDVTLALETERLKKDALKEKKLDVATYIFNHAPTSSDVYNYLCTQSQALLNFPNIFCLYQLSLLVPLQLQMLNEVFLQCSFSGMFPIASIFKHIKFRSAHENKFEQRWCQLT